MHIKIMDSSIKTHCISTQALKKQLTDKERIHREEQSIKIEEKDFELIPVSVNIYMILYIYIIFLPDICILYFIIVAALAIV